MKTPRIILFKAKREDNGKWIEGSYVHQKDNYGDKVDWHYIIEGTNTLDYDIDEPIRIDPTTLSQFTGMYDKNGKRIFENDIVKTQHGRLCVVKWFSGNSYCGWDLDPINTSDNLELEPPSEYFLWCKEDNEVVGNVFENHEFIKEALNE